MALDSGQQPGRKGAGIQRAATSADANTTEPPTATPYIRGDAPNSLDVGSTRKTVTPREKENQDKPTLRRVKGQHWPTSNPANGHPPQGCPPAFDPEQSFSQNCHSSPPAAPSTKFTSRSEHSEPFVVISAIFTASSPAGSISRNHSSGHP